VLVAGPESTVLINFLANYLNQVRFEHEYRFAVIGERTSASLHSFQRRTA
jgi:hypothetical protein